MITLALLTAGLASAGSVVLTPLQGAGPSPGDPTVTEPFPTAGDAYCSATNGCGTIPSGGDTAPMWTTGDYVISSVFTLPTNAVTDLTANWLVVDDLGGGGSETWNAYVNGVDVGYFSLADCNYCQTQYTVFGTVNFAAIAPVAGGYQVELILQNTVPGGQGSAWFVDGGTSGLSYSGVPEPGSLALMGVGFLGLAGLLRRKLRK